jgi:ABC-type uncharacterized transport system substrate-binding protein
VNPEGTTSRHELDLSEQADDRSRHVFTKISKDKTMLTHKAAQNTTTRMVISLMLISLLLTACGGTPSSKTYIIGVVNYVPALESVLAGFKARMAELGYVEGQNVAYLYDGVLANASEVLSGEVKRLLDQKVALLLTMGTQPTLAAQKAIAGTAFLWSLPQS